MSLLDDTFNNSCITDINFSLEGYNYYNTGKEVQLASPLPVLPPADLTTIIETSPSSEISTSGHFTKNSIKTGIQQICATIIIDMIYAYPRMMTRRETLPPFMHPYSPVTDNNDDQNKLPEHLANCMGIAQLFAARSDDTCSFVWATIRAEIRGFKNRMHAFNKYDMLSALQASLLYLIIRVVEQRPQAAEDDFEMLAIYDDVCTRAIQLTTRSIHQAGDRKSDLCWKDWIYMESIRRVACVWYILGLVFHTRTGRPCYVSDHYRDISLPCTKNEWEAKTEAQWRKEHNISCSTATLHTFGDLMDAHQNLPDVQSSEKLNVWNVGIDHLGMVLNLAVRIV
ncbi:hypothetical protein BGZ60DRAFT_368473 [Tricladium varicosporioides]|nr:hypothetical protein BGZ60DRAFT_368473 [Hymenoscyphus varicosporioides]